MIVLVLFIGGIQLLCLSIIGAYLAHVYDEVKGRPSFVVESILNPPEGAELPEGAAVGHPAGEPLQR